MNVLINGYSVESEIEIQGATTTDGAGGCADICEVTLPDSVLANDWQIVRGMTLEIIDGGYSTGMMYIDEIDHKKSGTANATAKLRAASLAQTAKDRYWNCFENVTLGALLRAGAGALGLEAKAYGVSEGTLLRRVVQRNQTWPEFLEAVFRNEGATIKFDGGSVIAIDYAWAFAQEPACTLRIDEKPRYIERPRLHAMRVRTGIFEGNATDSGVAGNARGDLYNEQIYSAQQAKRTACGRLLEANLGGEIYRTKIALDTGIAAMSRIDLIGHPRIQGNWFAYSVTHDFMDRNTELSLMRCITTVK